MGGIRCSLDKSGAIGYQPDSILRIAVLLVKFELSAERLAERLLS
jgi:hypothetical protein